MKYIKGTRVTNKDKELFQQLYNKYGTIQIVSDKTGWSIVTIQKYITKSLQKITKNNLELTYKNEPILPLSKINLFFFKNGQGLCTYLTAKEKEEYEELKSELYEV